MKPLERDIQGNASVVTQENQIIVVQSNRQEFKLFGLLRKTMNNRFVQEIVRFGLYAIVVLALIALVNKNPSSTIYSTVQMQQADKDIFLRKQIPGLFPPLSSKWSLLLNKWSIQVIRGQNLRENFNERSYQLEFKHFEDDQKADLLYITRDNCNGHVMMNWQVYGNNIYFNQFQPPKSSMIIPNQPEDEKCILGGGEIIEMLKYSTIWTVTEENGKTALFLLIEKAKQQNYGPNNLVLIANQVKKD